MFESKIFMLLDSEGNFMDLSVIDADFFIQKNLLILRQTLIKYCKENIMDIYKTL